MTTNVLEMTMNPASVDGEYHKFEGVGVAHCWRSGSSFPSWCSAFVSFPPPIQLPFTNTCGTCNHGNNNHRHWSQDSKGAYCLKRALRLPLTMLVQYILTESRINTIKFKQYRIYTANGFSRYQSHFINISWDVWGHILSSNPPELKSYLRCTA